MNNLLHCDRTFYHVLMCTHRTYVEKIIFSLLFFLFDKGAKHLRDVFYRMGLSNKDIVALSGGHTLVTFSKDCKWV